MRILLTFILLLATDATDTSRVTVERAPATVTRVTFDPANPPPNLRKMRGNEAAFTRYDFNCSVNVKYEVVRRSPRADGAKGVHVVAQLRAVRAKLTLDNKIFLPQNANVPLRSHEEGHREINEHIYDTAEPIARKIAEDVLQKEWSGDGADEEAAGKAATDAAVKELCDRYLDNIAGRASRVGDYYDQVTAHGTILMPTTKAIERAFKMDLDRERKPATTQPVER